MNYWTQKEERAAHAWSVTAYVKEHYADAVQKSVSGTRYFPHAEPVPEIPKGFRHTELFVRQETSVDAVFREACKARNLCVLNFASYKEPGGKFLEGSSAQEESLCHESTLYPVLSSEAVMNQYYRKHMQRLNRHVWYSDLLYSPGILFIRETVLVESSVITCAAPNKRIALTKGVTPAEISKALCHRIDSVLYAAAVMNAETLILGAFGCGVFGNDLHEVSFLFRRLLETKYAGVFQRVVFAIPDQESFAVMKNEFGV